MVSEADDDDGGGSSNVSTSNVLVATDCASTIKIIKVYSSKSKTTTNKAKPTSKPNPENNKESKGETRKENSKPKKNKPKSKASLKENGTPKSSDIESKVPQSNAAKARPPVSRPTRRHVKVKTALDTEIQQLSKRYPPLLKSVSEAGDMMIVTFPLSITDPDFPFDLPSINISLRIDIENYPQPTSVKWSLSHPSLPAPIAERIKIGIECTTNMKRGGDEDDFTLRKALRVLERNLERWMVALPEQVSVGSIKIIPSGKITVSASNRKDVCSDVEEKSGLLDRGSERVDDVETIKKSMKITSLGLPLYANHNDSALNKACPKPTNRYSSPEYIQSPHSSVPPPGSTLIDMVGVECEHIAIITPIQLAISFKCSRCTKATTVEDVRPGTDRTVECNGCKQYSQIKWTRQLAFDGSWTLGWIECKRTMAIGLISASLQASCSSCISPDDNPLASSLKISGVMVGERVRFKCLNCRVTCKLSFEGVKWEAVHHPSASISSSAKKSAAGLAPLKIGQPLPLNGACEHYKKSFRWFRFPCCGQIYPCDSCHQEQSSTKHPVEWATRQVCGQCSREFPTSVKYCLCGAIPGESGKKSAFWEGGKGTRDQSMMSRKDTKKYRNKAKTVSNPKVGGAPAKK